MQSGYKKCRPVAAWKLNNLSSPKCSHQEPDSQAKGLAIGQAAVCTELFC
jgi:hypothetical protein